MLERITGERIPEKKNVVGFSVKPKNKIKDGRAHRTLSLQVAVSKKETDPSIVEELMDSGDLIPEEIDGMKTDVIEIGQPEAMILASHRTKQRPFDCGCSGIRAGATACTTGLRAMDKTDHKIVMIVNDHCGSGVGESQIGSHYLQPSPLDGGEYTDVVGWLKRRYKMEYTELNNPLFNRCLQFLNKLKHPDGPPMNPVDACVIGLRDPDQFTGKIHQVGGLRPSRAVNLDGRTIDFVSKAGRTTGVTDKMIPVDDQYYVKVRYPKGYCWVGPVGLLYGGGKVQGGDSSSPCWFESDRRLAGQIFAASPTHAMYCLPELIEKNLNVRIIV